ncbi:MAG: hypothetical protein H8E28_14375 [Anaerolineae bacterium]|nr:hypothetical protein [Anaerolineae bacterium]
MTTKPTKCLLYLLIAGLLLLSGCQFTLPQTDTNVNIDADANTTTITVVIGSPQSARDAVMLYIRDHYGLDIPVGGTAWTEEAFTAEGVTSTAALKFTANDWVATIIFPKLAPEAIIYTISIHNSDTGFRWEGQINADGTITEIVVQQFTPTTTIAENEQPLGAPTPTATNTATAAPSMLSFTDTTYRFSVQYPDTWQLTTISAGAANGRGGFTTKFIQLQKDDFTIKIQYKLLWENTAFDDLQPPGVVETRSTVMLLGKRITQNVVVDERGKDKLVFYGDSADDIAYYIRIETTGDEIPADIVEQAAWIVSTIQRTGEIIPSPVDTATATQTPTTTPTASLTPIPNVSGNTTSETTATNNATNTPQVVPTATKVIPTPNIVNSVAPNGAFAYDFGANACLATWANKPMNESGDPNQVLPCLGTVGSSNGFITRIDNPIMEHRMDDEITLWIHPNEDRYGYIQGMYPKYTVQAGDRFNTTIGCMANYPKCSLDFQLYYKDAGGAVHSLGEWEENYNGQATVINLDLSSLAGQEVQFILRTVALTENADSAQGFWFVPRIMH